MPLLFSVGSIGESEFRENARPLLTFTLKNCFHLVSFCGLFFGLSKGLDLSKLKKLELGASESVLLFLANDFKVADR